MTEIHSSTDTPADDAKSSGSRGWRDQLRDRIPEDLGREIDIYETQLELKRQGQLDDKIFAETRLRRGAYGQRYDNGQRHDGSRTRTLSFPCSELTKGPNTVWDAPGMLRVKIPFGALDADQMEVLADLAEECSDGICHITTRQDVQLHFIHIDDTPDIMRRLAEVGITTQEACGNSVRNVTACPTAGVCGDQSFDVTPYSRALAHFLLGHKDAQDFGRKVKISFSGCSQHACGLAHMHDLGFVAATREVDGQRRRGFELYVGGGLGAVPHQAKLLFPFLPEEEILPVSQAICRVFARLGEKRNRSRARLKFLVAKLGIDEVRRLVEEERRILPENERWTAYLADLHVAHDGPTREPGPLPPGRYEGELGEWLHTNTSKQPQEGFAVATVHLPLGDLTARQMRGLAEVTRRFNGGHARATVEQNLLLRWIPQRDLPELHRELAALGLGASGAGTLIDITACPGTDTCKLGISSSRGLAAELCKRIAAHSFVQDQAVTDLRIKVSGCFNSCGQHHVADIGFYGVSRKQGGRTVPHFQVVLGGQWSENAGAYGLAVVAVPSKRIPEAVDRITRFYVEERRDGESFQQVVARAGKARVRALLDDLTPLPLYREERQLFSDWGDPREYTIGDIGKGECAGEVISLTQFGLADSEREVFEAQLRLDEGDPAEAVQGAYRAMVKAAEALVRSESLDVAEDPAVIIDEFDRRFFQSERFHDPFAGGKFAQYLFEAHRQPLESPSVEDAHRRIEEAQLFIEAAHGCYNRMATDSPAAPGSASNLDLIAQFAQGGASR